MKINQKGFSLVELLIAVVVLGLLGTIGWMVYDRQTNITSNSTNSQSKEDERKFLVIKEWGVKFPLVSSLESVVYTSGHYNIGGAYSPDSARLGLTSLGSDCSEFPTESSAPLGTFVRYREDELAGENVNTINAGTTSLHELSKTAVIMPGSESGSGTYHYAYAKPTSDCVKGDSKAIFDAAVADFGQAIKQVKSAD